MSRIAIIGPGAVGGIIAAWLGHTGRHELTLCARGSFPELRVETASRVLVSQPRVITRPVDASPVDWVLVTTKSYDAAGAAAWLGGFGRDVPVAILQNGVEHVARFTPYVAPERILPVVVDIPAERSAPGRIRQRGPGLLTVADDPRGREFTALFAGTELNAVLTADFRSAAWRKLCLNSAGVINALLLQPTGVFRDEAIGDLALAIIRECMAVGRAEGAVLDDSLAASILQSCRSAPPDGVNSLQADRAAGRPMEIDARNGAIVRLGRRHGIPTPCNEMAVALLNAQAARPNRPTPA